MPYKDPEIRKAKHKAYSAQYYKANREKVRASSKVSRRESRDLWLAFKAELSCSVCGFSHPAVIDFHHPPGTKKYAVNKLIRDGRYILAYKEIEKCIILCANCHRIHHHNEKGAEAPLTKPQGQTQTASSSSSASTS